MQTEFARSKQKPPDNRRLYLSCAQDSRPLCSKRGGEFRKIFGGGFLAFSRKFAILKEKRKGRYFYEQPQDRLV
jgi:hypothetical protein